MSADHLVDLRACRTVASATLLVQAAREEGLPVAAVLEGSGIDERDLGNPEVEILGSQEIRVVENLLRLGVDPSFAFRVGARYRISAFGLLGYALMNSETMRDAVELCARFLPLAHAYCAIRLTETETEATVFFECSLPSPALRTFAVERDMAALAMISRDLTGGRLPLRRWWIGHRQQAPLAVYQGLVRGEPQFDAPSSQWTFDRAQLDTPLPLANAMTRHLCVRACEDLLSRRQSMKGFDGKVRSHLMRHADRMPSLEEMADEFCLTPRTLRRRLADEGTTFRDIVLDVRHTLAESMLREGGVPIQEIASRLGYQDATSFITAFKRWSGMSPAAFRRAGGAG